MSDYSVEFIDNSPYPILRSRLLPIRNECEVAGREASRGPEHFAEVRYLPFFCVYRRTPRDAGDPSEPHMTQTRQIPIDHHFETFFTVNDDSFTFHNRRFLSGSPVECRTVEVKCVSLAHKKLFCITVTLDQPLESLMEFCGYNLGTPVSDLIFKFRDVPIQPFYSCRDLGIHNGDLICITTVECTRVDFGTFYCTEAGGGENLITHDLSDVGAGTSRPVPSDLSRLGCLGGGLHVCQVRIEMPPTRSTDQGAPPYNDDASSDHDRHRDHVFF